MITNKSEVDKSCGNVSERIVQRNLVEDFLKNKFNIIGTYTISDDGIVDVYGTVVLKNEELNKNKLTELPIQFGYITGQIVFMSSMITTLKFFPKNVNYLSLVKLRNLKSLEFFPKCNEFSCHDCTGLEYLDWLNCEVFYGDNLNLKIIGTNFYAKEFRFNNFPTPTADEMRRFIQLNPQFYTKQQAPWITLIKDYYKNKDIFRAAQEFEALYCKNVLSVYSTHYNEPFVKNDLTIIPTEITMSL